MKSEDLLPSIGRRLDRGRNDVRCRASELSTVSLRIRGEVSAAKLRNCDSLILRIAGWEIVPLLQIRRRQGGERCCPCSCRGCLRLTASHPACIQAEDDGNDAF